jgi:hypothetical protein
MPADKGFRFTPKQIVKHAGKLNERKVKLAKAVSQATPCYMEEKNKEKGMTSEQVTLEIQEDMGEWVPPSTIQHMVGQGRAGEAPKRSGPEGKITNAQFEALSIHLFLALLEDCHIKKPPESIPEPNVPSLQETLLERKR